MYIAESPKQGSKRFKSITKTISIAHLVILFTYDNNKLYNTNHGVGRLSYLYKCTVDWKNVFASPQCMYSYSTCSLFKQIAMESKSFSQILRMYFCQLADLQDPRQGPRVKDHSYCSYSAKNMNIMKLLKDKSQCHADGARSDIPPPPQKTVLKSSA